MELEINEPTWKDVINNFMKLDGDIHTLLTLVNSDKAFMHIGGGPIYYIVSVINDKEIFTLENNNNEEIEIELKTGGQFGIFNKGICIDREKAINTIDYYYNTGRLHNEYLWKEE